MSYIILYYKLYMTRHFVYLMKRSERIVILFDYRKNCDARTFLNYFFRPPDTRLTTILLCRYRYLYLYKAIIYIHLSSLSIIKRVYHLPISTVADFSLTLSDVKPKYNQICNYFDIMCIL